ncbi:hypothetical protein [Vibrio sp. CAU 1672]|uniref:hypothetical protein n=1 Tax=Vibrio sp. CAU 1672 TaxID=3032594 RepID=UPI0023DBBDF0|nr:hypothetical protein [Vibrio sp. CAU 1672]MDF2155007.1 hypothetical protein [Vibrio sp. CAU 1672]
MSDLRIALVAEGPTDYVIIEAALKAFLPCTFILNQLQPEATKPEMGNGWGGVLKWCSMADDRFAGPIDQDPTLNSYDLIIIHLDVDVSTFQYMNCGWETALKAEEKGWLALPCVQADKPISETVNTLRQVLESWLGQASVGSGIVCLPAQSSGTWLAAALLDSEHPLLKDAESDIDLENKLGRLPKALRVKKTKREYMLKAPELTSGWGKVKDICIQAGQFEVDVLEAI